jgi:23S rRNA-/tRNA-specific pseudouridylate synthase
MDADVRVVFEDAFLLIVDKPSGLPTQPDRSQGDALSLRVQARWPRATLHHRLDQPVSGLVLFGLDPSVDRAITEALRRHAIERTYLAVLAGEPSAWPSPARWTWDIDGQAAATQARRLGHGPGMMAVALTLETGRTHQIRKHAAQAGTPVLGDRRYGGDAGRWAPRLALHAHRLRWTHPKTRAPIDVVSPWPEVLTALWAHASQQTTHDEGA